MKNCHLLSPFVTFCQLPPSSFIQIANPCQFLPSPSARQSVFSVPTAPVKSPPSAACLISLAPLLSGVFLVGNYLLVGLANIDADLKEIVRYTPAHFYQGGLAVNGLEWDWLAGVLAASLLLGLVTWLAFLKRDIRVGGEHGCKLILFRKKNKQY